MTRRNRVNDMSVALYEGDKELVNYIAAALGCSKAEAIRSAIRAYAHSLQKIMPPGSSSADWQ